MTTLTPEDRARLRDEAERWPDDAWDAETVLALLDALDEAEATVERLRKWAQKESGFYNPAGDTVLVLLDGDA